MTRYATSNRSIYLPVRDDWLARREEEILNRTCRSSIRTTTSGTGRAGAT